MQTALRATATAAVAGNVQERLRRAHKASEQGHHADAERLCLEVLAERPGNLTALKQLAVLAVHRRRYNSAFRYATKALELAPHDARTCNVVGGVLLELGSYEAAAAALREALRIDPGLDAAVENYALVLQALNRREEAAELLAALLSKRRDDARLWRMYSNVRHFPRGAPEVKRVRALLSRSGQRPAERAHLQFALAKMLEDAGDAADAFRAYQAGNRMRLEQERREYVRVRDGDLRRRAARVIEVFQPDLIDGWKGRTRSHRGLTLVLGTSRSGKTLLEGPLAAHPAARSYGELDIVAEALRGSGLMRAYPASLRSLDAAGAARASEILDASWGDPPADGVLTHIITTPSNVFHAGTIVLLNPGTHIVVCERDPLETAMAIYLKYFAKPQAYAWDVDTIAEYVLVYERMISHWREIFPGRVATVRYEDMLTDPDGTVKRVLKMHGLDWHPDSADERGAVIGPETVGLAGSGTARSKVNPAFRKISDFYREQRPIFESALERARQRVSAALP